MSTTTLRLCAMALLLPLAACVNMSGLSGGSKYACAAPEGVAWMTDIEKYLSFVMGTFIAFGVTFEVPVVVIVLVRMRIVELATLISWRPYVIVGAFVIGAIFTPPDVVSQLMLAIPLCLLYELGMLLARFVSKPKNEIPDSEAMS